MTCRGQVSVDNVQLKLCFLAVHNQQRVVTCGGVEALVGALHRVVNRCLGIDTEDDVNNTQAALALVSTLDTVIADSGM